MNSEFICRALSPGTFSPLPMKSEGKSAGLPPPAMSFSSGTLCSGGDCLKMASVELGRPRLCSGPAVSFLKTKAPAHTDPVFDALFENHHLKRSGPGFLKCLY